jgi:hypothetical protein
MATKVVTLKKKRSKGKPLCYVDRQGNVRCRKGGRKKGKGSILVRKAVGAKLLKARREGKNLFVRGKVGKTLSVWMGKGFGKRRKKRKAKKRRKVKARRKARKGSKRCPKTRKTRSLRAALSCVRRGKGKTVGSKSVYNKALRRLRKSKTTRSKVKGKTLAKHRGRAVA